MVNLKSLISLLFLFLFPNLLLISCRSSNYLPENTTSLTPPDTFTVLIQGLKTGTGIIIQNNGETYYVLTSAHIVAEKPLDNIQISNPLPDEKNLGHKGDPYKIITPDNKEYTINYDTVIKDPQLDLAIFSFKSQHKYGIAHLSSEVIKPNQTVDIYGFKACDNSQLTKEAKLEYNRGEIIKVDSQEANKDQGYGVNYINPTVTGMSGSPVLNQEGKVIAIHGKPNPKKASQQAILRDCSPLDVTRFGNNWGISIQDFSKSYLAKQLAKLTSNN